MIRSKGAVLCPLGVEMQLSLAEVSGGVQLTVEAKSRGQLIDFGQSGREISKLMAELDTLLGTSTVQKNDTSAASDLCTACGTPRNREAKFCGVCGKKHEVFPA